MNINTVWIPIEKVSELLNIKEKTIKNYCYQGSFIYKIENQNGNRHLYIHNSSIKDKICSQLNDYNNGIDSQNYSDAPVWSKFQAEKYIQILNDTQNLKGNALQQFVMEWNKNNLNNKTSYSSVIRMRKRLRKYGVCGLLANYGNRAGKSIVNDDYFDYFKNLYLIEGAPSASSCWDMTFGYAKRLDNSILKEEFPSVKTFMRRLEREIPSQSIYLARYGQSAWNRKYGGYIELFIFSWYYSKVKG